MDTPNNLIELLLQRDAKACELLYKQYSARVYGIINKIVKDTAIADQLLDKTFAQVCADIKLYRGNTTGFGTWVLQLARTISINYVCNNTPTNQENNNLQTIDIGGAELVIVPQSGSAPCEHDVFDMILQGHKVNQVAEKMNIPEELVRLSIRKAMKQKTNRN